jgi:hypothetical protein
MKRDASDEQAYKLALIENLHREGLSHQEKVDALNQLGKLVQVTGLRLNSYQVRAVASTATTLMAGLLCWTQPTAPIHTQLVSVDRAPSPRSIVAARNHIRVDCSRHARKVTQRIAGHRAATKMAVQPDRRCRQMTAEPGRVFPMRKERARA